MQLDFLPDFSTWEQWNGNLILYFGDQQFPYVTEENWKQVASSMMTNSIFSQFNVPAPDQFDTWQGWAKAATQAVNGP